MHEDRGGKLRSGYRTRSRAPTVQSTARRSLRVPASGEPARSSTPTRPGGTPTWAALWKVFDVEIDSQLLESAEATVSGFGAVRALRAPLPMREVEVVETYASRQTSSDVGTRSLMSHARACQLPRPRRRGGLTRLVAWTGVQTRSVRSVAAPPGVRPHGSDPVSASASAHDDGDLASRRGLESVALVHPGLHDRGKGLETPDDRGTPRARRR